MCWHRDPQGFLRGAHRHRVRAPSPCPGPAEPQRGARQGRKGAGGDECFLTLRSETEKRCHSAAPTSAAAR